MASNVISISAKEEDKLRERILEISMGEGIKWGVGGCLVGGVGTYFASSKSINFMKYMSGKFSCYYIF